MTKSTSPISRPSSPIHVATKTLYFPFLNWSMTYVSVSANSRWVKGNLDLFFLFHTSGVFGICLSNKYSGFYNRFLSPQLFDQFRRRRPILRKHDDPRVLFIFLHLHKMIDNHTCRSLQFRMPHSVGIINQHT